MNTDPPAGLEAEPAKVQVKWFDSHDVGARPHSWWNRYYCTSTEHRGFHCESCLQDQEAGYDDLEDACCCLALKG